MMKPAQALRTRPSVRDKVDFFNDHSLRAASSSRERPARTPTRQTSEELLARSTPPLSYAASSGQASSDFDRNLRYDSEDDTSDLRSVSSFPSLPPSAKRPSVGDSEATPPPLPPPDFSTPPLPPAPTQATITNISSMTTTSMPPSAPQTPLSPSTSKSQPLIREEDEDAPPVHLDRSHGLLLVANTPKGRCVKASRRIPAHSVIDICPVLVLDPIEVQNHFQHTFMNNYTYTWPWKDPQTGRKFQTQALALGLGSLFNHSSHLWKCNVGWTRQVSGQSYVTPMASGISNSGSFNTFDSFATTATDSTTASKDRRQIGGNDSITYRTLRDIDAGEELCISYGPPEKLTFVDVEAEQEAREEARREREEEQLSASRGSSAVAPSLPPEPPVERSVNGLGSPYSPLENLWIDVDAVDIYSRIDAEHGAR